MSDFSIEARRSGWWATDSRRAVSGKLFDVILEKRGQKEPDDLSDNEAVKMGKALEETIGKIFEDETGIGVRHFTEERTHPRETWFKSHTDFLTSDGGLLEVKNFHAASINNYSEPDAPVRLPEPDYIQCIHEACVFDVPHVYFAVLFGGQRFRWWKLEFTQDQKTEFVQQAAKWWGLSQAGDLPTPETLDQVKRYFPVDNSEILVASKQAEQVVAAYKNIKSQMAELEAKADEAELILKNYMGEKAELLDVAGKTLVTWKTTKSTKAFDAKAFEAAYPDMYKSFMREKAGYRRFLVK